MKPSYPISGKTVVPVTGNYLGEQIAARILPFPVKLVGDAANRTPEAAKKWRNGLACPDLASTINMARSIPAVKWLVYQEMERGTPEGVYSPRLLFEAMSLLQQIANASGEHSQAARDLLARRQ